MVPLVSCAIVVLAGVTVAVGNMAIQNIKDELSLNAFENAQIVILRTTLLVSLELTGRRCPTYPESHAADKI